MIGTETGLRTPGKPQERAIKYGGMLERLDILVVGRGKAESPLSIAKGTTVYDVLKSSYLVSLWDAFQKGREILRESGNWVITTQDPFEIGLVGFFLSWVTRVPLHLQVHTDPGSVLWQKESHINRLRSLLFRFLITRAEGIRVVSRRGEEQLRAHGVPESKITRIPIVTEIVPSAESTINLRASYPDVEQIVVAMGRFEHEKGFDLLLRAFARVRRTFSGAVLLLVGKGSQEPALRRLVVELNLSSAVKFIPWARDTASYYRGASVVVTPSLYEGWGLVPVEALVAGGYVVMTDVGCAGEVIRHEETGLVVPPQNYEALASAVERMFTDKVLKVKIDSSRSFVVETLVTQKRFYQLQKESWKTTLLSWRQTRQKDHPTH